MAVHNPASVFLLMLVGQVIEGGWLSVTVTVKLHVASGPEALEAVQVTVVVPTGKACGEVIVVAPTLQVMVGTGQPVVVGVNDTEAVHCPGSVFTLKSDGQLSVGGIETLVVVVLLLTGEKFEPVT
jgi:hypothetical protein